MGHAARRRLAGFVPWVALAAVTVFAVARLDRGGGEPAPSPPDDSLRTAAHATEKALDEALRELETLRTRARTLEEERDGTSRRAEAAEAQLAAARARLGAVDESLVTAETAVGELQGALQSAGERIVALEARRAAAEDTVLGWLRDVAAKDLDRQARAWRGAERGEAADFERLADLVVKDAARAPFAAKLLGRASASEATDAAVIATLLAPDAPQVAADRLAVLGGAHATRVAVLEGVLEGGAPEVRRALLANLATHASLLDEEAHAPVAALLAQQLDPNDRSVARHAARSLGMLRAGGAAPGLAALLSTEDVGLRAAAAYALSRVPDLEEVKAAAARAVVTLLHDASLEVRTAGVMLAEALVGETVPFDPAADEAERGRALEALRSRLP